MARASESGYVSARAVNIGIEAFPIASPYTLPVRVGKYFRTASAGSTALSAAERIRKMRGSRRLCVAKLFASISVIISELFLWSAYVETESVCNQDHPR